MTVTRRTYAVATACIAAVIALAAATTGTASTSAGAATATAAAAAPNPITHVVVILEENHSFDNVLGTFCTEVASGQIVRPGKDSHCDGTNTGITSTGTTIPLASAADYVPFADHSVVGQQRDIDAGKMDGFSLDPNCAAALANCYSQYDPLAGPCATGSCIPNYAALATRYTVSDRTFEAQASPSWAGHLVWATANQDGFYGTNPITSPAGGPQPVALTSGWGCDSGRVTPWGPTKTLVPSCVPTATGDLGPNWTGYTGAKAPYVPTIFDKLDAKNLSWKIYGGAGAPGSTTAPYSAAGWQWAICPTFSECLYSAQKNNVVPASQVAADAAAGQLPSYSVVTPTAAESQHNNNSMSTGDNFVGQTVAALQAGPEWSSTAVFVTYDDCGCFTDHVNPQQYNASWGIRVPMVIVSPYVKLGYTDAHPTTFAGTLAYVEHLFGLAALSSMDATAYDYRGSFCLNPATTGCTPAGLAPTAAMIQRPAALSTAQKSAQVTAGLEDT